MSNLLIIENYKGGKSFVVRGNTIQHKEQLKKMNGRWNPRLEGGAGWIFSNKHLDKIKSYNTIKPVTNIVEKTVLKCKKIQAIEVVPEITNHKGKKIQEIKVIAEITKPKKIQDIENTKPKKIQDIENTKPITDIVGKTVLYTNVNGNVIEVVITKVSGNVYYILLPDGSKRVTNKNRLAEVNTSFRKRKRTKKIQEIEDVPESTKPKKSKKIQEIKDVPESTKPNKSKKIQEIKDVPESTKPKKIQEIKDVPESTKPKKIQEIEVVPESTPDVNSSKKQLIYDENNTSIKIMFIVFILLFLYVCYLITKCKSFCTQSFLDKLDLTTINY